MKTFVVELAAVLSEQASLYEQVLSLSREELAALQGRRPDCVIDLVRRKETVLLQVKTLDESRRLICARIAADWHVPSHTLTLGEIQKRIAGTPAAEALAGARERLTTCIEQLRQTNDASSSICQSGIEIVRRIVEGITPAANGGGAKGSSPWAAYGIAAGKSAHASHQLTP